MFFFIWLMSFFVVCLFCNWSLFIVNCNFCCIVFCCINCFFVILYKYLVFYLLFIFFIIGWFIWFKNELIFGLYEILIIGVLVIVEKISVWRCILISNEYCDKMNIFLSIFILYGSIYVFFFIKFIILCEVFWLNGLCIGINRIWYFFCFNFFNVVVNFFI